MIFDVFGISDSQTLQFRHHFGNGFLRWEIRFFGFSKFRIFRAGFLRFRRSRARPEAFGRPRLGRELEPGRPFMDLLGKSPRIFQNPSKFLAGDGNLLIFLDFHVFLLKSIEFNCFSMILIRWVPGRGGVRRHWESSFG